MRNISENDLSVVIPLLAKEMRELRLALRRWRAMGDEKTEDQMDEQTDDSDTLTAFERTLDNLREEYEAACAEGVCLPSYEDLVAPFEGV